MRETFLRARFGLYVKKKIAPARMHATNQTRPLLRGNLSTMIIISSHTQQQNCDHVRLASQPRRFNVQRIKKIKATEMPN